MKSRLGKLFFCLIICFFFGSSLTVVRASEDTLEINNYINDYANLIDEETKSKMNQAGSTLEGNTGAQVVFITVDSLEGQDIRQVAYKTFNKYGLGDENLDNGILFIVSMEEKERYMEVGTGLEGTITDIASQHLQTDYLVPQFQDGNYQKGLEDLYYQIIDAITNGIDSGELDAAANTNQEEENGFFNLIFTIILIAIILFILFYYSFSGSSNVEIILKPGQRYKLNVRGYDFNDESILVSSQDPSIVQVEADGWITGVSIGKTVITLQKLNEHTKKQIPVHVTRRPNSSRRNDRTLEYLLWGSMLSNRHRYTSHRSRGGFGGGFGSGGFGGFSGGGGSSRGGGAGGSW